MVRRDCILYFLFSIRPGQRLQYLKKIIFNDGASFDDRMNSTVIENDFNIETLIDLDLRVFYQNTQNQFNF